MLYIVALKHTYGVSKKETEIRRFEIEVQPNSSLDIVAEAVAAFYDDGYQLYLGDSLEVVEIQEVETEVEYKLEEQVKDKTTETVKRHANSYIYTGPPLQAKFEDNDSV